MGVTIDDALADELRERLAVISDAAEHLIERAVDQGMPRGMTAGAVIGAAAEALVAAYGPRTAAGHLRDVAAIVAAEHERERRFDA